jgi:hypothetical protein
MKSFYALLKVYKGVPAVYPWIFKLKS